MRITKELEREEFFEKLQLQASMIRAAVWGDEKAFSSFLRAIDPEGMKKESPAERKPVEITPELLHRLAMIGAGKPRKVVH